MNRLLNTVEAQKKSENRKIRILQIDNKKLWRQTKVENFYCEKCKRITETAVKKVQEAYPVKNENVVIESDVRYCAVCGEALWDNALDEANLIRAYDKFKEQKGLLSSDQIKQTRKKYALSQSMFAKLLGVGEKTITRYENGAIQDKAQDNLIRLIDNAKIFEKLFRLNQKEIGPKEIRKLENILLQIKKTV
ncbi:MAG: type II toxin-antitoxin system MqsA family antitoxin [Clostridiales Family XIII bacterium]|jgi:putative zinc finger/helix-turn-helix YgiT family protein|nr:type II toxin-antitoxin system MqsA family antitoxin [Clostridiales Family XIII bacterium]